MTASSEWVTEEGVNRFILFFKTGIFDLIPAESSPDAALLRGLLESYLWGPDATGILDLNAVSVFFILIREVDMVVAGDGSKFCLGVFVCSA